MIFVFCLLFLSCSSEIETPPINDCYQIKSSFSETEKTNLTIKLTGYLPIGWGTKYSGKLISIDSGEAPAFSDSLFHFYEGVGSTSSGPSILDINKTIKITLIKSGEYTDEKIHWPPNYDSGFTDQNGVVWNLANP